MDKIIADFEGFETSVYKDCRGIKTVGVGFNMEQSDARQIFTRYVPGVSFDDVFSGKTSLTRSQVLELFQSTLKDKIELTKRMFPSYDSYPEDVKTALVNGMFRGEFTSSQKTVKYIVNGDWSKVADEYLDRKDYRASRPGHNGGIKKRMDYNAAIFRKYAAQLKK